MMMDEKKRGESVTAARLIDDQLLCKRGGTTASETQIQIEDHTPPDHPLFVPRPGHNQSIH